MTTAMTKRLARAVLIAGLALPVTALLPATAPLAISKAHAAGPTTVADFKSVLAAYGKWGTHDKYGDIWVPTVTPQGWHPYPACQWVYTKQGWYFDDNTPWGSIVHHYGRWQQDDQVGWFWVPDQDWSPGWVAWRQSDQWVGWAPLPPQQDMQIVNTPAFDNDKLWLFMAADKFRDGCSGGGGDTVMASQAYDSTQPVTWFGLAPGDLSDIDIDQHWTINNIIKFINFVININIDIDNNCPQPPNGGGNPPNGGNTPPNGGNNPPGTNNNPPPPRLYQQPLAPSGGGNNALIPTIPPAIHITFPPTGNGSINPGRDHRGDNGGGSNGGKTGQGLNGRTVGLVNGNGSSVVAKTVGLQPSSSSKSSSVWRRPHLSVLPNLSHSLRLTNPGSLRPSSVALSPRFTGAGLLGKGKGFIR